MTLKEKLAQLPFKKDIEDAGGSIYAVGGAVRDELLSLTSKDLDLLITNVDFERLQKILPKHGRIDLVGESFGIIKFKEEGSEEIDIALPRTEKKTGDKHTDFTVDYDCTLPIEKDLERRDFTINAMAMNTNGAIIDPYGGLIDIEAERIKLVNKDAFKDDPLRMLRAIQFVSRFKEFTIEDATLASLRGTTKWIKTVSPERVVLELQKIVEKGDPVKGAEWLQSSNILSEIFDHAYPYSYIQYAVQAVNIKTLGEFLFFLHGGHAKMEASVKKIRPDNNTIKEVQALHKIYSAGGELVSVFEAIDIYPAVVNTEIFKTQHGWQGHALKKFKDKELPSSLADICVNGYTLMQLGLQGQTIGEAFRLIVKGILSGKVKNDEDDIIHFVKREFYL